MIQFAYGLFLFTVGLAIAAHLGGAAWVVFWFTFVGTLLVTGSTFFDASMKYVAAWMEKKAAELRAFSDRR